MRLFTSFAVATFALVGFVTGLAGAREPIIPETIDLGRPVDFGKDIHPILDAKCIACHNKVVTENRLNLETVAAILKGGSSGAVVLPGDPAGSMLYSMAAGIDDPVMPPDSNKVQAQPLSPRELGLLKQWIAEGAHVGSAVVTEAIAWKPVPASLTTIFGLAMDPGGRFVACGRANQLDVYDLFCGTHEGRLVDPALNSLGVAGKPLYPAGAAHQDFVHCVAYSPVDDLVATGGYREVKLWRRPRNQLLSQVALGGPVSAVSLDASGQIAIWALADNTVQMGPALSFIAEKSFVGHSGAVLATCLSGDGRFVLSAGADKTIRIWSVASGELLTTMTSVSDIQQLCLAANDTLIVSAHADFAIRTWSFPNVSAGPVDSSAAVPVRELMGHTGAVTALVPILPGATEFVSGSEDGSARRWRAEDGAQLQVLGHGQPVRALAVRSEGPTVATAGGNFVKLWKPDGGELATLKLNVAIERHVERAVDADVVAKSRVQLAETSLAAVKKSRDERVETEKKSRESLAAGEKAKIETAEKQTASKVALDAATAELVAQPTDEALKKKEMDAALAHKQAVEAERKAVEQVESARRGVVQAEKSVRLSDEQLKDVESAVQTEVTLRTAAESQLASARAAQGTSEQPITAVAFSTDGKHVATSGPDGLVRVWDARQGKGLELLSGGPAGVQKLAYAPGGQLRAFVAPADQPTRVASISLWDASPAWRLEKILGGGAESPMADRVLSLAFGPDGKQLVSGGGVPSRSGELLVWDLAAGTVLRTLPDAHSDTVNCVAFSPDGRQFASGGADKFVKVHDGASGAVVRSFEGHTSHVLGVSWKADMGLLASAGADNAIKLWNLESGEQFRTINNYGKQVTAIQFIGVTDNLASCSGDTTVKFHTAQNGGNYRSTSIGKNYFQALAVNRDETLLVGGGDDGILHVWNGTSMQSLYNFAPPVPVVQVQAAK